MFKDMRRNLEKEIYFKRGLPEFETNVSDIEALIKILFVSPYPTDPEKKALLKKNYFNFQSRIFFLISLQPERIVQCKQCYLSKFFVYSILLPIVGLYSKICLKRPLKDICKSR